MDLRFLRSVSFVWFHFLHTRLTFKLQTFLLAQVFHNGQCQGVPKRLEHLESPKEAFIYAVELPSSESARSGVELVMFKQRQLHISQQADSCNQCGKKVQCEAVPESSTTKTDGDGKSEENTVVHKLQNCVRCKNAWYCSKECQVAAWPKHKKSCDVKCTYFCGGLPMFCISKKRVTYAELKREVKTRAEQFWLRPPGGKCDLSRVNDRTKKTDRTSGFLNPKKPDENVSLRALSSGQSTLCLDWTSAPPKDQDLEGHPAFPEHESVESSKVRSSSFLTSGFCSHDT